MSNTLDSKVEDKSLVKRSNYPVYIITSAVILCTGIMALDVIRKDRLYRIQINKDKEILEKYAPQIENGNPLTIEQGIEFIYKEHDNNPKDGKISIPEALNVLDRAKIYENRKSSIWKESGKNLYRALFEIDNKQIKSKK